MKLKECENFWILGAFLGAVGLVSALVLSLVSSLTAPAIARADQRAKSAALRQLIPDFDNDPAAEVLKLDGVAFMAARRGGALIGVVAEAETNSGYAGTIRELVGFDPDGRILAVLVTDEKETPGLGKNVCERKFKKTIFNFFRLAPAGLPPNEILDQFSGRRAGDRSVWRVRKDGGDFEYRTGATVTSRAVTGLTGRAAEVFSRHRAAIAAQFAGAKPEVKK